MQAEQEKEEQYINSFKKGIKDGVPIALGYLSVSFTFGMMAVAGGLPVSLAVAISMTNLTSAGQFAGLSLLLSGGGYFEMALTQLVINLRYALMSVSLSQRLGKSVRLLDCFLVAFVNTDEVFAVAMAQNAPVGRRYLYGLILTPYLGWTAGTLLGAVAGNVLPAVVISALGLAIYAMFIAIVVPQVKKHRATALCVAIAVGLSCAFYYIPALRRIPSGFSVILCAAVAAAVAALVHPVREEHDG